MCNYFVTDLTITTDKPLELFASVYPEDVDWLGDWLELPISEVDKIKKDYQSPIRRKEAYLDLYVYQHPCPSWKQVAEVLRGYPFKLHQQADFVEMTYVKGTQSWCNLHIRSYWLPGCICSHSHITVYENMLAWTWHVLSQLGMQ